MVDLAEISILPGLFFKITSKSVPPEICQIHYQAPSNRGPYGSYGPKNACILYEIPCAPNGTNSGVKNPKNLKQINFELPCEFSWVQGVR